MPIPTPNQLLRPIATYLYRDPNPITTVDGFQDEIRKCFQLTTSEVKYKSEPNGKITKFEASIYSAICCLLEKGIIQTDDNINYKITNYGKEVIDDEIEMVANAKIDGTNSIDKKIRAYQLFAAGFLGSATALLATSISKFPDLDLSNIRHQYFGAFIVSLCAILVIGSIFSYQLVNLRSELTEKIERLDFERKFNHLKIFITILISVSALATFVLLFGHCTNS